MPQLLNKSTVKTMSLPKDRYMKNTQGHFILKEHIKPIDIERNNFVMQCVNKVKKIQKQLKELKKELTTDLNTFIQQTAKQYKVDMGGVKGNITLMSFDGNYQIKKQMVERISFDEGLQVAKAIIDECIRIWSQSSPGELRAVIEHAFKIDKEGKINTNAILALRRLNIKDPRWEQAMQAIVDSIHLVETKSYIRIYERMPDGKLKNISLEMSSL